MTQSVLVPLAEHFHSIQGEGAFTGLPMHFLRFPGCSVGREQARTLLGSDPPKDPFVVLPNESVAKVCTAFDGQEFFCDTDYEKHEEADAQTLLTETYESVMCFTGGEPLLHQTKGWFAYLMSHRDMTDVHVETSGTIEPMFVFDWLTVSPKKGWKPEVIAKADQLKFLVTPDTNVVELESIVQYAKQDCRVYLSPIFDPNSLVPENLETCLDILSLHPEWLLGCQWHKFLNLR